MTQPIIYSHLVRVLAEQVIPVNIEMAMILSAVKPNRRTMNKEHCFQQVLGWLSGDVMIRGFNLMFNPYYVSPEEKGMKYTMRLTAAPFEKLRDGSKRIELRLYDEKRKKIKTGDTILFISLKEPSETLLTRVVDIYTYASFDELYGDLPLEDLGYSASEVGTASPKDMEQYYTPEEQAQFGVVAFRLEPYHEERYSGLNL